MATRVVTIPKWVDVLVFGSNLMGIHGAGSAREALRNWGAIWGQGRGFQGKSYAIPTKGYNLAESLPLSRIAVYVDEFIEFAKENRVRKFWVVPVGCGLAGYSAAQMRPLFHESPNNCYFVWDLMDT
jgi:hypothetical protein